MLLLLDTSILIELFRKGNKQNSSFYQLAEKGYSFAISSITKYEIEVGAKQEDILFWKQLYKNIQILDFDDEIATQTAKINQELKKKNQLIEFPDMAIAATALIHNIKVATLNTKHFKRIPLLKLV